MVINLLIDKKECTLLKNTGIKILITFLLLFSFIGSSVVLHQATANAAVGCQFLKDPIIVPAFCDTLSVSGQGQTDSRAGIDLNGNLWGVSRIESGGAGFGDNLGQGAYDTWVPSVIQTCPISQTVLPDQDVQICNNQLKEALNDNGGQILLAAYPKQPFDISGLGRTGTTDITGTVTYTGTAVFDVSNDTQGVHGAWPEWWYTDQPVPAPHDNNSLPSISSTPRNGLGILFDNFLNGSGSFASGCHWPPDHDFNVGQITVVTNYIPVNVHVISDGCAKEPINSDAPLNHIEVQVSTTGVVVYATDSGGTILHKLGHATIALPFTRGLTWLEDAHYNANKFGNQRTHTFSWANFGFDGPVLNKDLTFDVPENKSVYHLSDNSIQLGWKMPLAPSILTLTTLPVTNLNQATNGAALLLNHADSEITSPLSTTAFIKYSLNGNTFHTINWPYPDTQSFSWRTLAFPVSTAELVSGPNQIRLQGATRAMVVANVDILLIGAGGGAPTATPTVTPTDTPSATSTDIFTPVDTATSTVTDTPTNTPVATFTNTSTPTDTLVPTNTFTETPIPTDTPTFTNTPTNTATFTDTPTDTSTPTNTPTPIPSCANQNVSPGLYTVETIMRSVGTVEQPNPSITFSSYVVCQVM